LLAEYSASILSISGKYYGRFNSKFRGNQIAESVLVGERAADEYGFDG
jgi:hypothetical protein